MTHRFNKAVAAIVGTAALAVGGSAIANAASGSSSTTTTTSSNSTAPANMPAHGSATHEDAEKPVTGATAEKVQAAAVKYVGSGTAGAVTTDFTQTGYETTVTKADGSSVEVHLDGSLNAFAGHGAH